MPDAVEPAESANVAFVARCYAAWNRYDWDAVETFAHPNCFVREADEVPGAARPVGRAAVMEYFKSFLQVWEQPRFNVKELRARRDHVVAVAEFSGRARQSGVTVAQELTHVWHVVAGRAMSLTTYWRMPDAVRAVELADRPAAPPTHSPAR